MRLSDDLERLALEWFEARSAFLSGEVVRDASSKLPTLVNSELFTKLGSAENALAAECRSVLAQMNRC